MARTSERRNTRFMLPRAGDFQHVLLVERRVQNQDAIGGSVVTWEPELVPGVTPDTQLRLVAQVRQQQGYEGMRAASRNSTQIYVVHTRWPGMNLSPDTNRLQWLQGDGSYVMLQINSVRNIEERQRVVSIEAVRAITRATV